MNNTPSYCPRCGAPVDGAFCSRCGTSLQQPMNIPAQAPVSTQSQRLGRGMKHCKVCKRPVAKNAKTCPYCGAKLKGSGCFGFLIKSIIGLIITAIIVTALFRYLGWAGKRAAEQPVISTLVMDTLNELNDMATSRPTSTARPTSTPRPTAEVKNVVSAPTNTPEPTAPPAQPTSGGLINGMRPEFKEAMDAYEAFYNEYFEFMDAYNANPSDWKLLARYGEMVLKLAEWDQKFEKWDDGTMNSAETQYYLEVHSRILNRLGTSVGSW